MCHILWPFSCASHTFELACDVTCPYEVFRPAEQSQYYLMSILSFGLVFVLVVALLIMPYFTVQAIQIDYQESPIWRSRYLSPLDIDQLNPSISKSASHTCGECSRAFSVSYHVHLTAMMPLITLVLLPRSESNCFVNSRSQNMLHKSGSSDESRTSLGRLHIS